jgi:hypothetical protein
MDRMMGVLTLQAPAYRSIAKDPGATKFAAIIVVAVALIGSLSSALILSNSFGQIPQELGGLLLTNPILLTVLAVLWSLVYWGLGSWVVGVVAKLFGGKTDTGEMLRVLGFASIFNLLFIIPCLGPIVGTIFWLFGEILGIREASEVSTGKAILIAIIGGIVVGIVWAILAGIVMFVIAPTGVLG